MTSSTNNPNDLLALFTPTKLLNQDQSGRRIVLLGSVAGEQSLLLIERAAFALTSTSTSPSTSTSGDGSSGTNGDDVTITAARALLHGLSNVRNLGANDVYHWFMANGSASASTLAENNESTALASTATPTAPDLKLDLITPCTAKHIRKYSPQGIRMVTETASIYAMHVEPYIRAQQAAGRMNWVYNILEGRKEQEDIIYRETRDQDYPLGHDPEGFLLLPDMNWDRETMAGLRILGLVERRDLLSLRDLKKRDVPWLKGMMERMLAAVEREYRSKGVERDCLKVYMHYQPTYYHFHIHILSALVEPNATQAVGKAFSLPNLISQLETMQGGPEAGMQHVDLTYSLGEESELWRDVFRPLKEKAFASAARDDQE